VKRSGSNTGVSTRPGRPWAAAGLAALALGVAGCSTLNPATIATPYQAADGTSATIPGAGIKLNNFLVVSEAKGEPGQVVGAVTNPTSRPVLITMQTDLGETGQPAQTQIRVPANGITQVGPSGTQVLVSDTPVEPGSLMGISANYETDGGISLSVPVVLPTDYYASYTVGATPSESSSAEPTDSPSQEPTAESSVATEPTKGPDSTGEPDDDTGATPNPGGNPGSTSTR